MECLSVAQVREKFTNEPLVDRVYNTVKEDKPIAAVVLQIGLGTHCSTPYMDGFVIIIVLILSQVCIM